MFLRYSNNKFKLNISPLHIIPPSRMFKLLEYVNEKYSTYFEPFDNTSLKIAKKHRLISPTKSDGAFVILLLFAIAFWRLHNGIPHPTKWRRVR